MTDILRDWVPTPDWRPIKNHIGVSGGKDSTALLLWAVHESGYAPATLTASFCDTGNEHEWTYDHVRMLSEKVFPITWVKPERDFFSLAFWKGRFPAAKSRFCTQHLKIIPTEKHISRMAKEGFRVIAHSGVRADESPDRAKLTEWDYDGNLLVEQRRPLLKWTLADVLAIHQRHGIPLNPLYAAGAERVGCWPCIMSRKAEIRNIALNFPERIDQIEEAEKMHQSKGRISTFFHSKIVPERFRSTTVTGKDGRSHQICTIRDVVRWSLTGKRAKGSYLDNPQPEARCQSGYCE